MKHSPTALDKFPPENGIFMSSAVYITNASKCKQCGPNQTFPDLDPHCLPLPIYKLIMSANICSRRFEYRYVFFACILILKALIAAKSSGFIG